MNYSKPKQTREEYPDLTATEHDILADQIAEELAKKPPAAAPSPLLPPPVKATGADQLIQTAEKAITGAHDAVISHIDEMITKLTSVKASIQIKKEGAIANLKEFVNLSAMGLDTVRDLDRKMQELIQNHLK